MASDFETNFSPTSFHFFSIVLQKTLQSNKIQIPKKIVRRCGSALADHVLLKLPCGSKWKLGLTKSRDGKVWIDKVWPEFAEQYSIKRGNLLVFKYEGNSQFHVVIFDNTTTEIDYPFGTERQNKDKFVKEEPCCDDNSVENFERPFSRACPKTRERSALPSPGSHKRNPKGPIHGNTQTQSHQFCDLRARGQSASSDKGGGGENSTHLLRFSSEEKARALNKASGFKSPHPFFMIAMHPSHVHDSHCSLSVPCGFARLHLGTRSQVIVLRAPDGRTWSVKYSFKKLKDKSIGSKPKFESGWKQFVQDNHLRRGDVCVFVMTKSTCSVLFEVSFFRDSNGTANSSPVPGSKLGVGEGIVSHFQSENPFFTVVIQPSYTTRNSRCNIPIKFARTYLKRNHGCISLCSSDGRSQSVRYRVKNSLNRKSAFELCDGWFKFVRESSLKKGDICTFELTNRDEFCFKVHIVKAVGQAYKQKPLDMLNAKTAKSIAKEELEELIVEHEGNIRNVKSEESDSANQGGRISKASEAANKFCSYNPYFQVDFPSSHLDKRSLNIPISFARGNLEEKTQIVTLQVDDKSWPVKLLYTHPTKYSFSRGWPAFLVENSLHPRDVCVFELIERNQAVMKVSIFRET